MPFNDPNLLKDYFYKCTKASSDFSTPIPGSFLQSLANALLIEQQSWPLSMPVSFSSSNSFGRAVSGLRVANVLGIHKIAVTYLVGKPVYTNIQFIKSSEDLISNIHSSIFKRQFLRTLPSEWLSIVRSYRIRTLRSEGYKAIATQVLQNLNGSYPASPLRIADLLDYATQLRALLEQAKLDIQQLDLRGSRPLIARDRHLVLTENCWPKILEALPVLHKIVDTITKFNNLPILLKEEILALESVPTVAPLVAKYLPLHHALLRCLFPYIASLVDDKIILPVCPMVFDVFNSRPNNKIINNLHELGKREEVKESEEESPKTPPLAEEQAEGVSFDDPAAKEAPEAKEEQEPSS